MFLIEALNLILLNAIESQVKSSGSQVEGIGT